MPIETIGAAGTVGMILVAVGIAVAFISQVAPLGRLGQQLGLFIGGAFFGAGFFILGLMAGAL